MFIREGVKVGGKELSIETGRMAKQADGAVVVRYGDTMVLVTAVSLDTEREVDFLPLTVEYQEKTFAAGKIPGGYFKREGRPTETEILTCRLIDRPCRPLFPKGWRHESQIIALVLSSDRENSSDVLAMTGASAALTLSNIPWDGPIAGVRVGRVEGKLVINPTLPEQEKSDINLVMAVSKDAVVMVEGGADSVSENDVIDALLFGQAEAQPILQLQEKLRAAVGKPKRAFSPKTIDPALVARVREVASGPVAEAYRVGEKQARTDAIARAHEAAKTALAAEFPGAEKDIGKIVHDV